MNNERIKIEICCGSLDDAVSAQEVGADRIELNSSLFLGGLTPSLGTLIAVKKHIRIPVMAMVRPRAAGFYYSPADFETMEEDARLFIEHGADGIVFGFLHPDGTVDMERCARFVFLAKGRPAVFHRAIDVVPDPLKAIDQLIELGITRVLTSGQEPTAPEGAELIAEMVRRASGRIEILPGGGITRKNAKSLVEKTGVSQIHFASLTPVSERSTAANPRIYYGGLLYPPEDRYETADRDSMRSVIGSVRP
jgi:copper homeostasis protein